MEIYATWTDSAMRAQVVTYTVQHAGGSTDILVNQQQPSAEWFRVGAISMAPDQNHRVEVTWALEGVTVAQSELTIVVFMVPNPKPRHRVAFTYS